MKKIFTIATILYLLSLYSVVLASWYYLDFVPNIDQNYSCGCFAAADQAAYAYYLAETHTSIKTQKKICEMGIGGTQGCVCTGSYIPLAHTESGYNCYMGSPNCSDGDKCDAGILDSEQISATYISSSVSITFNDIITNIKNGKPMIVIKELGGSIPHRVIITGAGVSGNNPPVYYIEYMEPSSGSRNTVPYNSFRTNWTESLILEQPPYINAVEAYVSGFNGTVYPAQCSNGQYITQPLHCDVYFEIDPISCTGYCYYGPYQYDWQEIDWPYKAD